MNGREREGERGKKEVKGSEKGRRDAGRYLFVSKEKMYPKDQVVPDPSVCWFQTLGVKGGQGERSEWEKRVKGERYLELHIGLLNSHLHEL